MKTTNSFPPFATKLSLLLPCFLAALFFDVSVAQDASSTPQAAQIKVYVSGGVAQKGAYLLPSGASILDAIKAAHGFQEDAARVALCRGTINGHARSFAQFRARAIRDGIKTEVLLDGDIIRVELYLRNIF